MRRRVIAALIGVTVLVAGAGRQLSLGSRALLDCDVALERDDERAAIAHARAAAEAVLPGSPYPARGYERLDRIARAAEGRGDDLTAMAAWRAMRAASTETRGLLVGSAEWRARADEGIARAATRSAPPPDPSVLAELLARDDSPSSGALALVGLLFIGLVNVAGWRWRSRGAQHLGPGVRPPSSR
jgi:hypothetical protein